MRYAPTRPMMRVLLISPSSTDADVRAHAKAIASIPGVEVVRGESSADDRLADTCWTAAKLFRERHAIDVVVTVGVSALAAAYLGWRGPLVHIPIGRLPVDEGKLIRRLARRGTLRLVTGSPWIADKAKRHVINPQHVSIIRPSADAVSSRRREIREQLGLTDDQLLVYLPGVARPGSNHRLGLWASNILYFRDPTTRVLITGGGPGEAFVRRFITSAEMWPAMVSDASLDEADRAFAADIAICGANGAPDLFPLVTLTRAGTPLAGMRSTWVREGLSEIPATLADEPKARLLARAALEAMDGGRAMNRIASRNEKSDVAWNAILSTLVGRA